MGTRIKATQLTASSVSDLTNTTWVFNSGVYVTSAFNTIYINFNSYHNNYTSISFNNNMGTLKYNNTIVYDEENIGGWMLEDFQEITITGGNDVTNSQFISWLEENATNITPTPSGTNHTHLGSLSIIKKHFGDLEVIKETLNGVTIYEKGSPAPSSNQVVDFYD